MQELRPEDPDAIGPYRLSARLGEGGMGRVYLGAARSGRRLAVKVIRPEIAADPGFRERFRREVAAARTVGGFWTAPIVDADPDGPVPWVASDYIDAPDLAALVRDGGPLPEVELRALAVGLAEALEAVHRAELVHRDLKPSNILVTGSGPRVIDFGISKAAEGATALTGTGLVIGTPGFMSPEQATGTPVGPPSDVFALGAVLAYAASGEGPFGEGSVPALLYRVVHDVPALDAVPQGLRPLVAACLEKAPEQRPSASRILDLLVPGGSADAEATSTRQAPRTPEPAPREAPDAPGAPDAPQPRELSGTTELPETVEVSAGLRKGPSGRIHGGGGLMAIGTMVVVFGTVFGLSESGALAAAVAGGGVLLFLLGAVIAMGDKPARRTVKLTAGHFHCQEERGRHWSSRWPEVTRVTVRPARNGGRSRHYWQLAATLREDMTVPFGFDGEGPHEAAMEFEFDDSEDPRPALRRLDDALRRYAGERYVPDATLTGYLDRA
ncbi:serine/threonine-protein kinase [Streptomyces hydrogenans]|uniref:serine/threonine-protein kinase n=1 Tax=Streptomyces hydrogenans TaxID=1873719 RepID=UPI0038145343